MSSTIENLLNGKTGNHVFPMLFLHGESADVIRKQIGLIADADCKGFVVEARQHPEFCGPKWWQDLDVVLEEARKRKMQFFIADDSRCPSGYANGALKGTDPAAERTRLVATRLFYKGRARRLILDLWKDFPPRPKASDQSIRLAMRQVLGSRGFDDDTILATYAVNELGQMLRYPVPEKGDDFVFDKPEGDWTLYVIGTTRNLEIEKDYLNLTDPDSVRFLLDAVYEPHYKRYAKEFGKTIAGFYADNVSLTGGFGFDPSAPLSEDAFLPFSEPLKEELQARLGANWLQRLYLLWEDSSIKEAEFVRFQYKDALTALVRDHYSYQLSTWCFAHQVAYVGVSEELQALHPFRSTEGFDWSSAGSLHTVAPAVSGASIVPHQAGQSAATLFKDCGYQEGLRQEKKIADRYLVSGINHFFPYSFSTKPFSPLDGQHLFYADGNDAQISQLHALMSYLNRAADLLSSGPQVANVAVLDTDEWADPRFAKKTGAPLLSGAANTVSLLREAAVNASLLPLDVFTRPDFFHTEFSETLTVHTQTFRVLVLPRCDSVPRAVAEAVGALTENGCPVLFLDRKPERILDEMPQNEAARLLNLLNGAEIVPESELADRILHDGQADLYLYENGGGQIKKSSIRYYHCEGSPSFYFFLNESDSAFNGLVSVSDTADCFLYDAWRNETFEAPVTYTDHGMTLPLQLEPGESVFLILEGLDERLFAKPFTPAKDPLETTDWIRSTCKAICYPDFVYQKNVTFPDKVSVETPDFSGIVRYTTTFRMEINEPVSLEITDAEESVEVFLNGQSVGLGIKPPFRFNLQPKLREGTNELRIEVATTMEKLASAHPDLKTLLFKKKEPVKGAGITGEVILRRG